MGEKEFNDYLRKKAIGQQVKSVRRTLLQSLVDGISPIPIPKKMVKAVTLMSLLTEA